MTPQLGTIPPSPGYNTPIPSQQPISLSHALNNPFMLPGPMSNPLPIPSQGKPGTGWTPGFPGMPQTMPPSPGYQTSIPFAPTHSLNPWFQGTAGSPGYTIGDPRMMPSSGQFNTGGQFDTGWLQRLLSMLHSQSSGFPLGNQWGQRFSPYSIWGSPNSSGQSAVNPLRY